MTRIILGIICLCAALIIVACGGANKVGANIIYDTRAQIAVAPQSTVVTQ